MTADPNQTVPAQNSGDAAATKQGGSGGGDLGTDVGGRDELKRETNDDEGMTRATKHDKVQPDTGTRADLENASGSR